MFGAETCSAASSTNTKPRRDQGRTGFPAPSRSRSSWDVRSTMLRPCSARVRVATHACSPGLLIEYFDMPPSLSDRAWEQLCGPGCSRLSLVLQSRGGLGREARWIFPDLEWVGREYLYKCAVLGWFARHGSLGSLLTSRRLHLARSWELGVLRIVTGIPSLLLRHSDESDLS
jgi:hypothetical protein